MNQLRSPSPGQNLNISDRNNTQDDEKSHSNKEKNSSRRSCIVHDILEEYEIEKLEGITSQDLYTPQKEPTNIPENDKNLESKEKTNVRVKKESTSTIKKFTQTIKNSAQKESYKLFDKIHPEFGKNFPN